MVNFPVTDVLRKNHQFIRDLFEDIEDAAKSGCDLTKKSQSTLRELQQTNPDVYRRMAEEGWFKSVANVTLAEAFDEYINSQEKTGWDWKTVRNWRYSKEHVLMEIAGDTPVSQITLKAVDSAFVALRATYSAATLEKDAKNVRQLFAWLHDMGDITENPVAKLKFQCRRKDRVAAKEYVPVEKFLRILAVFPEEQLEQKCLFAYYRLMGARQNDPTGDTWSDFDERNRCINRYDIKKRGKLGPCPVPPLMMSLLCQYRDVVVAERGRAEGPLFPWLLRTTPSRQWSFFRAKVERASVPVWEELLNALRASRDREIRRMPNGVFLASKWLGHSVEISDEHYDGVMATDMSQVMNDSLWNVSPESDQSAA